MKRYGSVVLGVLLTLGIFVSVTSAQVPEKRPGMAYRVWVFDGLKYRKVFAPEQAATLYVLADHPTALSAHRTLIYYWPLTRHYLPDWSSMDEPLAGHLEVSQAGRLLIRVEPVLFSLVQPEDDSPTPSISLVTGAEAEHQYARYQEKMADYWKQVESYNSQSAAYEAQLREAIKDIGAGKSNVVVPTAPEAPRRPAFFVTRPRPAYVISLEEGRYTIQFRGQDGQIATGSTRQLVAFRPRRKGLSYTIIPETRWTQPERSDVPDNRFYLAETGVFYFQPRVVREYNESFYLGLKDPQDTRGRRDHWIWVQQELVRGGSLEMWRGSQHVISAPEKPYWVQQIGGPALGYNILEYDPIKMPGEKPTFRAYRLEIGHTGSLARIDFRNSKGELMAGSEREVRLLTGKRGMWLYLPALLPLLPAIALATRRRMIRSRF